MNDPLAEPLLADLRGLPALHITAAEFDVLRSDLGGACRARDAGVSVDYALWPGMIHASLNLMGWIDAMGHVDAIGRFLEKRSSQAVGIRQSGTAPPTAYCLIPVALTSPGSSNAPRASGHMT